MNFDKKAQIVSEAWMLIRKSGEWDEIVKYGDVGFPLAYAHDNELATIKEGGKKYVLEMYDLIANVLQIPNDEEYEDFEAMLDKNIEMFSEEDSEKEG